MSRGQVTITLGRSGQKVVKRPWPGSDGLSADVAKSSGNKRGLENSYADDSLISTSKRLRGGRTEGNIGYTEPREARIAASDLRLKLMRKRLSKRIKQEIEERKKIELSEEMSRTIQSSEGHGRSSLRNTPSTTQMESLQSSYNSITMNKLRPAYYEGMPRVPGSIASSKCGDEIVRLPLPRTTDASRIDYMARPDLSDFSRSKGPVPMTAVTTSTRTSLNASNPAKKILPPVPSMLRSTNPVIISPYHFDLCLPVLSSLRLLLHTKALLASLVLC